MFEDIEVHVIFNTGKGSIFVDDHCDPLKKLLSIIEGAIVDETKRSPIIDCLLFLSYSSWYSCFTGDISPISNT